MKDEEGEEATEPEANEAADSLSEDEPEDDYPEPDETDRRKDPLLGNREVTFIEMEMEHAAQGILQGGTRHDALQYWDALLQDEEADNEYEDGDKELEEEEEDDYPVADETDRRKDPLLADREVTFDEME